MKIFFAACPIDIRATPPAPVLQLAAWLTAGPRALQRDQLGDAPYDGGDECKGGVAQ